MYQYADQLRVLIQLNFDKSSWVFVADKTNSMKASNLGFISQTKTRRRNGMFFISGWRFTFTPLIKRFSRNLFTLIVNVSKKMLIFVKQCKTSKKCYCYWSNNLYKINWLCLQIAGVFIRIIRHLRMKYYPLRDTPHSPDFG